MALVFSLTFFCNKTNYLGIKTLYPNIIEQPYVKF